MRLLLAATLLFGASAVSAQSDIFMQQVSGTSRDPQSSPMAMMMWQEGRWMVMLHDQAFLEHANDSGFRGGEKTFSTNWGMASASRPLWHGVLGVRAMLSLEPATITNRSYPELFQTGETAYGKQLIDAQHPHDFFMELAAEYLEHDGHSRPRLQRGAPPETRRLDGGEHAAHIQAPLRHGPFRVSGQGRALPASGLDGRSASRIRTPSSSFCARA